MIECRPGTLIPRWETEEWSSVLATKLASHFESKKTEDAVNVVDICCGTGCIALNLANLVKTHPLSITGIDISQRAIDLSRANQERNASLITPETDVKFLRADLFSSDAGNFMRKASVITMNPPYILLEDEQSISLSARRFEPRAALVPVAGTSYEDGEVFYAHVVKQLANSVNEAEVLAFEIGSQSQAERVSILIDTGLQWSTEIWKDSAGRARCVFATRPIIKSTGTLSRS